MKWKRLALAGALASGLALAAAGAQAHGMDAGQGGWMPPCMYGQGMMGPGMMGPGMSYGMGPGMPGLPGGAMVPGMGMMGTMGPGMMGNMMSPGMWGNMMGPGMPGLPGGAMVPGMGMMGTMGPGMMGNMMSPGMWGNMMGPGMGYGYGVPAPQQAEPLSVDDVRNVLDQRLQWMGNPNLKVGNVAEKDKDTIIAEIVTKDDSLVERYEIDRKTGFWRPAS